MNFLQALHRAAADIAETLTPAIVEVRSGAGSGAGTIWHEDGLILTNAHVLRAGPPQVRLHDGRALPARVLAEDATRDLAALAVDARGLPTVDLGESGPATLRPGQWVMALGHPFGVRSSATTGVVISAGSDWPGLPAGGGAWLVVSLPLRPGHSGGPVLDSQSKVIGINTMITGPKTGVAVPVNVAKLFLKKALTRSAAAAG
ncbi:MAG: S1C family serine protease [Chloroflexota bacterium]